MRRQVMIRQGCVDGFSDADPVITVFRGIPYAKPPVDELRWREPQPAEAWDGVLEAGDFAPMPMQPLPGSDEFYGREWQIDADTPMAEDCLYLNIWTPALRGCGSGSEIRTDSRCDGHGLPVMVWLYGGAFQTGSTCEKEFNGEQLARQGVVVVSIAYRLNVFGFFAHAMLEKEAVDGRPCANFGFLDQRMGIQWVKDNIALFGGDPANITVFGQSAGCLLYTSRMAPSVCRRSMLSIQDESGCWRLPPSVVMTFKSCNLASRMAPRSTSRAQTLSKSWNTISIIRWLFVLVALREYPYRFNTALMVCRVSSETSALPLSALDTVERE